MATGSEWIGTYKLPTGGPSGGKRRFGVHFANMEEIVAGETLSGTPTVTVSPSGPTISAVAYNTAPLSITVNGRTLTAAAYTVLLFTVAAGVAPAGDYTLTMHAETSGGAIFEPTATLKLE